MPARISELEIMDEDRLTEEVLDKFVNCHEQTYEEFLSTFPHLSKEDNVTKRGAFGTDSSENVFPSEEEQVDNFLDLEDLDIDEETQPQMSKDLLLLPGEVEEDVHTPVPPYIPSVAQPFTPEVELVPTGRGAHKEMEEVLGDEVQPFSLDEEFDYDAVTLTPKFTPAEREAITELSKQQRQITNTDLEEPHA
uniref:Intraflagellar transport associated protein n=1 Tax=Panthera tigris altaica TaxID=74533 RepID=A0A8C9K8S0_PANTA